MTILDKIIRDKKEEVQAQKQVVSKDKLKKSTWFTRSCYSLNEYVRNPEKSGIITEFKRQSPSKGVINADAKVLETTKGYQKYGASAVSILTDEKYFGGTSNDLILAREKLSIPILRKDFMVDEYQIYEAKSIGADVILLIAACLEKEQVSEFTELAMDLGMEVLFEIHTADEIDKLDKRILNVGINNRNLKTFEVDIENSKRVFKALPDNTLKIAESGISNPKTVNELRAFGFQGFLMGENFMKESDPAMAFKYFREKISS